MFSGWLSRAVVVADWLLGVVVVISDCDQWCLLVGCWEQWGLVFGLSSGGIE